MSRDRNFDRWYAATHVRILVSPSHELETFGATLMNYHLISQLEDHPDKVRVREGRLEAHPPRIITPSGFAKIHAEGFGESAREYIEWLKENEENFRILQYGYNLKSDNFSEQVITDSLSAVTERVKAAVLASNDKFAAVVQGVDDPWDIALVELWRHEVDRSAQKNIRELSERGKLF
ncbi:MAG: hypothetical protein II823_05340 [Kiritimatiellae bacterium]|nr:hypothetical protein [Kiritimatiellia bacterium]